MRSAIHILFFVLSVACTSVQADLIAAYDFNGGSATSTDTDVTTSASDMTFGPWNSEDGDGNSPNISSSTFTAFGRTEDTGGASGNSTIADAIASGDYFTFTLDPLGLALDYNSLNFEHFVTQNDANTTITFEMTVMTSATGFTAGDEIANFSISNTAGNSPIFPRAVDLSAQPVLLGQSAPVEFRFYVHDNSTSQDRIHRLDTIRLDAVQAIPEPDSMMLIFAGVFLVAAWRRVFA